MTSDPRLPLHIQVRDELLRRVSDRIWKTGEALPGEETLSAELHVSVGTMRKAMQALVQEGVLERVHGKGTFVTRTFERNSMLRFVRFREPGTSEVPQAAILQMNVNEATAEIAGKLGVVRSAKVLYLHRSRSYGEEVVLVEHIWLPHARFEALVPFLKTESPPLLYPVYDSLCGVDVSRALDTLSVDHFLPEDARVFQLEAGATCMRIERTMHDHSGAVVEWRVSFVPAEKFHYSVEIR